VNLDVTEVSQVMRTQVRDALYEAVDEVNELLPPEEQIAKSPETVLFGSTGRLDSLGLINLIVAVEKRVAARFHVSITLADEKAMSQKHSPFQTMASLIQYVTQILETKRNDEA
jgi:acyl carrier protein